MTDSDRPIADREGLGPALLTNGQRKWLYSGGNPPGNQFSAAKSNLKHRIERAFIDMQILNQQNVVDVDEIVNEAYQNTAAGVAYDDKLRRNIDGALLLEKMIFNEKGCSEFKEIAQDVEAELNEALNGSKEYEEVIIDIVAPMVRCMEIDESQFLMDLAKAIDDE